MTEPNQLSRIAMWLYETATVLVPAIIVWVLIVRYQKGRGIRHSKGRLVLYLAFSLYMLAVISITGAGTLFDALHSGLEVRMDEINLIPFVEGGSPVFYLLNFVMLVPFGFLLPLLWPQTKQLLTVTLFGFFFSLLIELSQLLNWRSTDINDLLMNTLGTVFGFLLFAAFNHLRQKRQRVNESKKKQKGQKVLQQQAQQQISATCPEGEQRSVLSGKPEGFLVPIACIASMFLGHLLFFNVYLSGWVV